MYGISTIIYLLPKLAGDIFFFQAKIRYEGCWPAFSMTRIGRFLSPHLGQREEMVALRLEVPPQPMDGSVFFFCKGKIHGKSGRSSTGFQRVFCWWTIVIMYRYPLPSGGKWS